MPEGFLIALLAVLAVGNGILVYFLTRRGRSRGSDYIMLQQQLQHLTDQIDHRLDRTNEQVQGVMSKQFAHSSKLIMEITEKLTKLDETNRRVIDVTGELKTLQNILQNPKQRGGLGEYYLDSVIGNVLPATQYKTQYEFVNGEKVDAVIFLGKKLLPVDSKFSLENYNRLIEAKSTLEREGLAKLFRQDLKNRIDETAKYIRPDENTMDFAFMFIPSEAIYNDLLINKIGVLNTSARDLIEYAFQDKRVIIVSPTTFLAYLQTVMQGLRSLQIEEQAKEIQKRVGMLGKHIQAYDTFMHKLGNSLGTTVNHYNTAHKELKKIDKDIVKITGAEPVVDALLVDGPQDDN